MQKGKGTLLLFYHWRILKSRDRIKCANDWNKLPPKTLPGCYNLLFQILNFCRKISYFFGGLYQKSDLQIKGEGVHPFFFVKLDFEIAVDQQTKAHNQTFEGVPDPGCPPVPALILSIFGSNLLNRLNMLNALGALLVATSLLNIYTKFSQNRIKLAEL